MDGKAAFGCKLAPSVPKGTVIQDIKQNKWRIGKPIGSGAFGDIYLASYDGREEEEQVVKVEPHSNGPLFVEIHAFLGLGREHHRVDWHPKNDKKPQGWVGIPNYYGSGSFYIGNERLRFLVLTRLGADIQKFFQSGEKPLPLTTALNVGLQIMESLEYIHSKNYTHNDIKAQNVLLGYGQDKDTVYLVDFGLGCKYRDNLGFHRSSEPDERKAHEGTLEYTSRDAHIGTHSRRGDLETLGYNLVHWVTGYLPWTTSDDPEWVQSQKIGFMFNIRGFLEKCFKPDKPPEVLETFLTYVNSLEFEEAPDYLKIRKLFIEAMRANGVEPYSALLFNTKKKKLREESSDEEDFVQEETRNTRSQDEEERYSPWSWEKVLSQDPESIIRQASRSSDQDETDAGGERTEAFARHQKMQLQNPTPEMQKMLDERERLETERQKLSIFEQANWFNLRNAAQKEKFANMDLEPCENTPVMQEVIQRRADRLAQGLSYPITPDPSDDEEQLEAPRTVKKAKPRRSTCSSRSTTPTESCSSSIVTRSRSTTPSLESPVTIPARRTTRSFTSGTSSPTSSRTSTPTMLPEYRASTPSYPDYSASSSRASTPDFSCRMSTRSRSRSESSEMDNMDLSSISSISTSSRVTRSRQADITEHSVMSTDSSNDFKLPVSAVKVTCTICGKRMLKASLSGHMDRKHSQQNSTESSSSILSTTRSGRIRKYNSSQSEVIEEAGESETSDLYDCPVCFVKIARLKLPQHFDELHSPARKITRKQFQESVAENILSVHASSDSPSKIVNLNSPKQQDEESATNTTLEFNQKLSF